MTPPKPDPNAVKPVRAWTHIDKFGDICLEIYNSKHRADNALRDCHDGYEGCTSMEVEIRPVASPSVKEENQSGIDDIKNKVISQLLEDNHLEIESLRKKLEAAREGLFTARTTLQILNELQTWDDCTTTIHEIDQSLELSSTPSASTTQRSEQSTHNALVEGSSPSGVLTTTNNAGFVYVENLAQKEIDQLQSQVESLTKDIIYYRDLWMKRINSDDAIEEERDQLRAEQTQLKDAIKEIIENYNSAGMAQSNWNRFQDSLYNASKLLSKSTPPSQEQTPSSVMKSMYEALKKTLEHLHPYNTPEVTIDRIVEAMRLYESMGFSQEDLTCPDCGCGQDRPCECKSQPTADKCLEWLLDRQAFVDTDMAQEPSKRHIVYKVNWLGPVSKTKLADGATDMEAVINAVNKEKESK